jgi:GTPase SAR1 family protein/gas vesicle protein
MPISRDLLQQLSVKTAANKTAAKQTGVGTLPRSIHRLPGLREWVSVESIALAPVPVKRSNGWVIVSLVAVPTKLEDGSEGLFAPWAAVAWSWPEKQVVQKIDLRRREDTASLRNPRTITAQPADSKVVLEPRSRTLRENSLFQALDAFLAASPDLTMSALARYYAGLLPAAVYPYYWALVPESREWLRPNVTAVALAPIKNSQRFAGSDYTNAILMSSANPELPKLGKQITKPSTNRWEHPIDLTKQIGPWLGKCLTLAESSVLENVSDLQALESRWHLPGFRLAVVGEFNRGKSTLVNRLLRRFIVPVDTRSTTAIPTSIVAGPKDRMEVNFSKKRREVRSLKESSWRDLLATDLTANEREVFAEVQLTVDDLWLRSLDVELIDTPGTGDLDRGRTSLVFELLSQSDAAVFVVSALAPFSRTEAAFLSQEVVGRRIDRILIVVSHLDTIAEAQRARMLNYIQEQVAAVSDSISVLPLHPVDGSTTETEVLDMVRAHIAAMVSRGDRRAWRSQQVAQQLVDHLSSLIKTSESAIAAARMNPAERQRALQQVQAEIRKAELQWQRIRHELDQHCQQGYQQLRENILNAKTDLIDALSLELSKTSNPKFWWERELPFRLRREFRALGRRLEDFCVKAIARDFEWLRSEVSRTFNTQVSRKAPTGSSQPLELNHNLQPLELVDLQRYRLLTRIGQSATFVCGSIFGGGPVGGVVAGSGALYLSERLMNEKLEKQRQLIAQELEPSIDRALDQYSQVVSEHLQRLYRQISEDMKHQQAVWQSAKSTALQERAAVGSVETTWQQTIKEALALKTEIITALQQ